MRTFNYLLAIAGAVLAMAFLAILYQQPDILAAVGILARYPEPIIVLAMSLGVFVLLWPPVAMAKTYGDYDHELMRYWDGGA